MALRVENISYEDDEGYPMLVCTIDGKPARISGEQKPTLSRYGIVSLGSSFKDTHIIQPEDLPEELQRIFEGEPLRGFVRDRQFWEEVFLPFAQWARGGEPVPPQFLGNWDT